MSDSEADTAERAPGPRRRGVSLALSAFLMSAAITLVNAFYAVQGPEILVQPPEQILLFKDGEGADAVLAIAVRLPMINTASAHGDIMVEAEARPSGRAAWFKFQSLVQPVFVNTSEAAAERCDPGVRCLALKGLLVIEKPDEMVDLPGGAARARYFAFPTTAWNCAGDVKACAGFNTFDQSVATLGAKPVSLDLRLKFHGDGDREVRCEATPIDPAYLRGVGWQSLPCERTAVSGGPLL